MQIFRKQSNSLLFGALALLATLCSLPAAAAGKWTAVGSTCTLDHGSVGFTKFGTQKVINTSDTQVSRVRYNVVDVDFDDEYDWLDVTYDQNYYGRVVARLKRVSLSNGGTWTIATFDSDSHAKSWDTQRRGTIFQHYFDFQNYAYFIDVEILPNPAGGSHNAVLALSLVGVIG